MNPGVLRRAAAQLTFAADIPVRHQGILPIMLGRQEILTLKELQRRGHSVMSPVLFKPAPNRKYTILKEIGFRVLQRKCHAVSSKGSVVPWGFFISSGGLGSTHPLSLEYANEICRRLLFAGRLEAHCHRIRGV